MNQRKIQVLLVSNTLSEGGAERFVSTLLSYLDRTRFLPNLCLFREKITYPLAADVTPIVLEQRGPLTAYRTVLRIRRLIAKLRPDIVLSNIAYTNQFVGQAIKGCRHRPAWVARVANHPQFQFRSLTGRISRHWLRRNFPEAQTLVANSNGLAAGFIQEFQLPSSPIQVIGNPVEVGVIQERSQQRPAYRVTPGIPMIFSMGRLHRQKRPDVMLDAFTRVLQRQPARLWICGDGPRRDYLADQIERRGLADHVTLLGFCDNPYPLLRQASLFLMTSDYEGLPNALLEAQALGVPAVATHCPYGPEEIVEQGATGILVEPGSPSAIAAAVEQLLADPDRRREMGLAAAERVKHHYEAKSIVRQWESLLAKLVQKNTPHRISDSRF